MSTEHGCDRQTDMTMKTRCSTEVAQRKMNRPINSGKRVDEVDRVDRFSVELSRFVRLDRFQGLLRRVTAGLAESNGSLPPGL